MRTAVPVLWLLLLTAVLVPAGVASADEPVPPGAGAQPGQPPPRVVGPSGTTVPPEWSAPAPVTSARAPTPVETTVESIRLTHDQPWRTGGYALRLDIESVVVGQAGRRVGTSVEFYEEFNGEPLESMLRPYVDAAGNASVYTKLMTVTSNVRRCRATLFVPYKVFPRPPLGGSYVVVAHVRVMRMEPKNSVTVLARSSTIFTLRNDADHECPSRNVCAPCSPPPPCVDHRSRFARPVTYPYPTQADHPPKPFRPYVVDLDDWKTRIGIQWEKVWSERPVDLTRPGMRPRPRGGWGARAWYERRDTYIGRGPGPTRSLMSNVDTPAQARTGPGYRKQQPTGPVDDAEAVPGARPDIMVPRILRPGEETIMIEGVEVPVLAPQGEPEIPALAPQSTDHLPRILRPGETPPQGPGAK